VHLIHSPQAYGRQLRLQVYTQDTMIPCSLLPLRLKHHCSSISAILAMTFIMSNLTRQLSLHREDVTDAEFTKHYQRQRRCRMTASVVHVYIIMYISSADKEVFILAALSLLRDARSIVNIGLTAHHVYPTHYFT
jgi:hypothetical protein